MRAGRLKTGAIVGFLVWLSVDLVLHGDFNFTTLTGESADIVVETVHSAVAGAAIAWALRWGAAQEDAAVAA